MPLLIENRSRSVQLLISYNGYIIDKLHIQMTHCSHIQACIMQTIISFEYILYGIHNTPYNIILYRAYELQIKLRNMS